MTRKQAITMKRDKSPPLNKFQFQELYLGTRPKSITISIHIKVKKYMHFIQTYHLMQSQTLEIFGFNISIQTYKLHNNK